MIEFFLYKLHLVALGFTDDTGGDRQTGLASLKIYLQLYLNRLQSSRRPEREAQRKIELMWLVARLAPDFKIDRRLPQGDLLGGEA